MCFAHSLIVGQRQRCRITNQRTNHGAKGSWFEIFNSPNILLFKNEALWSLKKKHWVRCWMLNQVMNKWHFFWARGWSSDFYWNSVEFGFAPGPCPRPHAILIKLTTHGNASAHNALGRLSNDFSWTLSVPVFLCPTSHQALSLSKHLFHHFSHSNNVEIFHDSRLKWNPSNIVIDSPGTKVIRLHAALNHLIDTGWQMPIAICQLPMLPA